MGSGEDDRSRIANEARERLVALRARLSHPGAPWSPEIAGGLRSVEETLDQLQEHCALLRDLVDGTAAGIFAKHRDGHYVMMNSRGAEQLGKTVEDVLGFDDRAHREPAVAERIIDLDREVMATGTSRTFEEVVLVNGVEITRLTTTSVWLDANGSVRGVYGRTEDIPRSHRDLADAEAREIRLRSMALEILLTEERERRSLASDLHHGFGQDIALARMKLAALRRATSDDLLGPIEGIERLIESAERSSRSVASQICPLILHDLGLVPAIEWLVEDLERRTGHRVHVSHDGLPDRATERTRVVLFRATRELLARSADTGGPDFVRFGHVGGALEVAIERGSPAGRSMRDCEPEEVSWIREQVLQIGGSVRLEVTANGSEIVTLRVPGREGST